MALYHQISSYPYEHPYYYPQNPYQNEYNDYSSYSYYQSTPNCYSYELAPTQSLIDSIQYNVYHSVAGAPQTQLPEDEDLNFPEYDPEPYKGGYDIALTYGKPLPPSDGICYPPCSVSPDLPSPAPAPTAKEVVNQELQLPDEEEAAQLIDEEEEEEDDEKEEDQLIDEEEEEEDDDEGKEEDLSLIVYDGVEESNFGRGMNQMPHGYGLEAFDLCENLFGYWPCLSRMENKCGTCGNEIKGGVSAGDDGVDHEWKRTADYLFGNPDPYRGWSDQAYQMQYQYHPNSSSYAAGYDQAHQYAQNSWFP